MDCSMPDFPVLHHLAEFALTYVHWVGDAIQPSHPVDHFFSCLQSFPESESFQVSFQAFPIRWPSIGALASASVLPMNIQGWFPSRLTGLISLLLKGLSWVFSNTTVKQASVLRCSAYFMVLLSRPYTTTGNTIALTRRVFVGKVMSLFSKTASRFVTAFITSPFLMVQCRLVLWYWVSPDWGCGPFKAWMEKDVLPSLHMRWGWIQFLGAVGRRLSFVLVMWASPFTV